MPAAPTLSHPPASAVALMAGTVDYAGLFPPAALSMAEAAAEYAAALAGPDAWLLGRFVVPAGRLAELSAVRAAVADPSPQWRISAIVADESDADVDSIAAFNVAAPEHAMVDAIESKPQRLAGIDWLADRAAGRFDVYVEVGADVDPELWLARVASSRLRAKIRTGGITAAAFPQPATVLAFLAAALRAGVRVKATAGLHHAVRGSYRLTYESDAALAPMYGYLNVLLAAAALRAGWPAAVAEQVLLSTDPTSLHFRDAAVRWGAVEFSTELLSETRSQHLVSFGSCSFLEPVAELRLLTTE